jgi:lycopene cyclase domain-containing protein
VNLKYLYLIINILVIAPPLVLSFDKKIAFYKEWKRFIPSLLIVIVPFLIWDAAFFKNGVWGFNEDYITGIRFFSLPLEEILFFVTIPYACVFAHYCLKGYFNLSMNSKLLKPTVLFIGMLLIALGLFNFEKSYSNIVFTSTGALLLISAYSFIDLGKLFYSFLVLLVPFTIVNGILTGTGIESEIVWYNSKQILGIRASTIPIEDFFYFILLFFPIVFLMELQERYIQKPILRLSKT